MDTSIFFLFLHILLRRITALLFPLVFRVREGPDWVCFGDAQSLPSLWRSSRPSRWSVFHFRPEHGWPAVNRRWPTISRYPITTKGVNKADYSRSVRWLRWQGADTRPRTFRG